MSAPPLHDHWTTALPEVLLLLDPAARGMFRQEIQRFLAFSRFQPEQASGSADQLREVLAQALRASAQLPALQATRTMGDEVADLVALAEHILARWRDAEAAADERSRHSACTPPNEAAALDGETFFGSRLGGPGRTGAITRQDYERRRRDGEGG